MKKAFCFIGTWLAVSCSFSQQFISIIPQPRQVEMREGSFPLQNAKLIMPSDAKAKKVIQFFIEVVKGQTGIVLSAAKASSYSISFVYKKSITNPEGYEINISSKSILVQAYNDKGLFWAVQTLRQLLPMEMTTVIELPCLEIKDAPQYAWRSNMLDVSRHFFSVDFIKKHIDLLSLYKFNTFHWHLTDDQGWRIALKKYPKLTSVGAWRKEADGSTHGGFYTQEEIKDIVSYAQQRNITIIPEIEMPGHCIAAIVAYPEMSCRKKQLEVPAYFGVINDVYCAGQERTYQFCQDVLNEVLALFPSKYIHIGGDEVPKFRWQQCAVCQQKIKAEGLKDEHELQSYFIKRIQKFLQSKGRVLIGWDEIMEGGADKSAVIEVWRGQEKAKEALTNGNAIIQTLYLDGPPASLTLQKSFEFNPAVAGDNKKVLGADCPLWTEWVTEYNAEYMLYPRVQAFAERLWNDKTSYADFHKRLRRQYERMDKMQVMFGAEDKNLLATQLKFLPDEKLWRLYAQTGLEEIQVFYSLNDEPPTEYSFSDSLTISSPEKINVVPMRKGKQALASSRYTIIDHKALGKKVVFKKPYHENYKKVGDYGLTNGIKGSLNFGDGSWMGWFGNNLDVVVDMDSLVTIQYLQLNCMQQTQFWILLPKKVEFFISDNGENWRQLTTQTHKITDEDFKPQVHEFGYRIPIAMKARYIRAVATNYGKLPDWHIGAGGDAWIFADELIVR
ncbi:MAG: family 20 glycosylhydrolase [Chitinophagaceae bacterium]